MNITAETECHYRDRLFRVLTCIPLATLLGYFALIAAHEQITPSMYGYFALALTIQYLSSLVLAGLAGATFGVLIGWYLGGWIHCRIKCSLTILSLLNAMCIGAVSSSAGSAYGIHSPLLEILTICNFLIWLTIPAVTVRRTRKRCNC